jgi:O-antigen ligase
MRRRRPPRPTEAGGPGIRTMPAGVTGATGHHRMRSRSDDGVPRGPKTVVRLAFYAFVFSIPFETVDIGVESDILSLSKIIGYLFILAALLQPQVCFRRPPRAFWCFVVYLLFFLALGSLQEAEYQGLVYRRLFQLGQMLVLLWASYNLMRYGEVARGTLWSLVVSLSCLAVLQILGVTSRAAPVTGGGERVSALGEDPNTVGAVLALGLVALIGLTYGQQTRGRWSWVLAWVLVPLLGISLIRTGSRGSLLSLAAGLLVLMLTRGSPWRRLKIVTIAAVTISFFLYLAFQSPIVRARWERTIQKGSLAQRENIFPAAWRMYLERPLAGWGPERHYFELGSRLGRRTRDTHNLYLGLLTEMGVLGAVPYLLGLWFCLCAAWRARAGAQGIIPLSLLVTVLFVNMSVTFHNRKLHWLVLAYALASGSVLVKRKSRAAEARAGLPQGRLPSGSMS